MTKLPTNIHSSVFNIIDTRVERLRQGRISVKDFSLLITSDDPFILIDDTIYAMSESEYYASRSTLPTNKYISNVFDHVLSLDDLSIMSEEDQEEIAAIKKALPNCPSCRYNRYKNQVYNIAKKYNIEIADIVSANKDVSYPKTRHKLESVVSSMASGLFKIPATKRKACAECVEKHIAQAYVVSCESFMGYPEYLSIGCGHLSEAIEEAPKEADALRKTLIYCLGKSIADNKLFVPIALLLPHIHMIKASVADDVQDEDTTKEAPMTLSMDITQDMLAPLAELSSGHSNRIKDLVDVICYSIEKYKHTHEYDNIIEFEGAMALLAEFIVPVSADLANTLRNIRLMFRTAPDICIDSGYDFKCITKALAESAE